MTKCGLLCFLLLSLLFLIGCDEADNADFDAPLNLEVQKITDDKVKLTWDYNTNDAAFHFIVGRKVGDGSWVEDYYTSTDDEKSYVDEIPTNSTSVYSYKVKAYNEDEGKTSSFSEPAAYFSSATAPTDLTIVQTGENKVKLTWTDNCVGEAGYKIDKKIGNGAWISEYRKLDEDVATVTDSVAFAVPLQYRVYAYMGTSNSASLTGEFNPSFPAPYDLTLSQLSQQIIRLEWNTYSQDQEGFAIERRIGLPDDGNDYIEIATVTDTNGVYTDYLPQEAATVYYRVRAYAHVTDNGATEIVHSAYSEIASILFNINMLGEAELTSNACDVAYSQNYAFVANEYDGLKIYYVGNEANPLDVGTLMTNGRVLSVDIQGSLLMVGHTNGGVEFYGISDILNPIWLASCETVDIPYDVKYVSIGAQTYVMVADGQAGLLVISLDDDNPANPCVVKRINTYGISYGLYIDNETLYLADGTNGVLSFDISDPSDPQLIAHSNSIGEVHALTMYNNELYAAAGENGLVVLNKTTLSVMRSRDTIGFTSGIAYAENRVYLADGSNGMLIVDPTDMSVKAQIDTGSSVNTVIRNDNMAYVGSSLSFRIIQVNP